MKSRQSAHKRRSLITLQDPKSPISEAFRTLRTNIQFASVDKELRTLMVTSSGPGEGKSIVSANLAITLAQAGKAVLLVDADMRKPTVNHTFRFLNNEGLTNVISGTATLEDVIKTDTDVEGLDVLTSGPIPPNPAELLGSKRMKALIEEAQTKYDVVLFDTPPVIAVTDAQILASQVDGVILVVSSGKTNQELAVKAKSLLETVQANIIGCVLNNRKLSGNSYYYYYYGER
ncbi:tyrosine-protein kinase YwqD [Caldalkalibacillus thermarum]|uniref:CpsD/CapB family tyrosine-protein kinase n=1 Tax=Caldalkalibacillus thermarum TaxID=296745 RepID=UPI0016686E2E|nr:CpsD/CapB family tyrosine-protein kinase [Caldalkalibacillus thermarum]GGK25546.1 tyrosine-protein kinase YwqD [Caldalkalibacillus thermarum]